MVVLREIQLEVRSLWSVVVLVIWHQTISFHRTNSPVKIPLFSARRLLRNKELVHMHNAMESNTRPKAQSSTSRWWRKICSASQAMESTRQRCCASPISWPTPAKSTCNRGKLLLQPQPNASWNKPMEQLLVLTSARSNLTTCSIIRINYRTRQAPICQRQ